MSNTPPLALDSTLDVPGVFAPSHGSAPQRVESGMQRGGRSPVCSHLAYRVARQDAMQEQALALWQHSDPLTARRALTSALDHLLHDLGWVRIRTNQGRKWMRECRALPLLLMGFDPADETLAVSEGYIHASGRRKREAALKMTPEARHARAKKAAAASAAARKQRQNEKQAN